MKIARYATIAAAIELGILAILLHSDVKEFLWAHPWWHSFFVGSPAIVFGIVEWWHSGENNRLLRENNDLTRDLNTERNKHLQQIAKNTEREPTQAERNADILRKYLRSKVVVGQWGGHWSTTPEIVEVTDDNLARLFTPSGYTSSTASLVTVRCEDVEILEIPQGDCPIQMRILKLYGPEIFLGEIKTWEERNCPAALTFVKGDTVFYAHYNKQGSSERQSLVIYRAKDQADHYILEASVGHKVTGDRIKISKDFMIMHIDYRASGFERSNSGGGGGLFIC